MTSSAQSPGFPTIPAATAALPIRHLVTKESIPFSSLYNPTTTTNTTPPSTPPQPTVTIFLRRWGCTLCRGYAKKLTTTLLPTLTLNGVRLVAIGFDGPGGEAWLGDAFFASDQLYVDEGRKVYTALGVKRPSALSGFMKLISSSTRAWNNEVRQMGIQGNFEGDGLQLGATFIISPTGQLWMERRQTDYGDHPSPAEIVAVLRANMKGWKDLPASGAVDRVAEETVVGEGEGGVHGEDVDGGVGGVKGLEQIGSGANKCNEDCF